MATEAQRSTRAEAVRAALARAGNPTIFQRRYCRGQGHGLNAEFAYQEARQRLPLVAIGMNMEYLKQQLRRNGYAKYIKHVVTHWWDKKSRRRRPRR